MCIRDRLAVLGTVDGLGLAGQQTDAGAVEVAGAGQLHGEVQALSLIHI